LRVKNLFIALISLCLWGCGGEQSPVDDYANDDSRIKLAYSKDVNDSFYNQSKVLITDVSTSSHSNLFDKDSNHEKLWLLRFNNDFQFGLSDIDTTINYIIKMIDLYPYTDGVIFNECFDSFESQDLILDVLRLNSEDLIMICSDESPLAQRDHRLNGYFINMDSMKHLKLPTTGLIASIIGYEMLMEPHVFVIRDTQSSTVCDDIASLYDFVSLEKVGR
jgi:hypothetical protein